MSFCGCTQRFSDEAAQYRLANNRPTWRVVEGDLPGITHQRLLDAIAEAAARWSRVCDVEFAMTNDDAPNLVIYCVNLDGLGNVLADCELPMPGLTQQRMRIDTRERWGVFDGPRGPRGDETDLVRVVCHELGHFLGLQHFDPSPPPQLLEPTYSQTIIKPQPDEAAFMRRWFGPPASIDPAPTPGPSGGPCTLIVQGAPLPVGRYELGR